MYKNMKIAILYICTGKYYIFWENFYNSAQKNLFPYETKHFFVFSDKILVAYFSFFVQFYFYSFVIYNTFTK